MAVQSGPAGRNRGDVALVVFTVAVVVMVVAVALVGAVGRSWVLAPVMVLHLAVTFAVLAAIVRMFDDGADEGR